MWRGIVPWNKTEGARPALGRFTAQCEYLVWGLNGPMPFKRSVGTLPGFFTYVVKQSDKFHLTGKPTALMLDVLRIVEPGGHVFDPFMGSGTTLVAAKQRGLRATGVELLEANCEIAANRLRQTVMDLAA